MIEIIKDWTPVFIGVISILLAKSSLDFSKRTSLVKESYDPILEEIKKNKKISLSSAVMLDFEFFKKLKDSYLYLAFESKEREYIKKILKKEEIINKYKRKAIGKTEDVIIKVLNQKFESIKKDELIIGNLLLLNNNHIENNSELQLYEMLLQGKLFYTVISNSNKICLQLGKMETIVRDEYEYEEFIVRSEIITLYNYINMNTEGLLDIGFEGEMMLSNDFDRWENEMEEVLKRDALYDEFNEKYIELQKDLIKFENQIEKRIMKLLIPNYHWNKYLNKVKKTWIWFYDKL